MQAIFREIWQGAPDIPTRVDQLALDGVSAATWTVPTGFDLAIIHYSAGVLWASRSATAQVPSGTLTNGLGSTKILDGSVRRVSEGKTVSFFNATACTVTFDLFSGQ